MTMTLKHTQDVACKLVFCLKKILQYTGKVYSTVSNTILPKVKPDYDRDMFDLCTLAIDNGLIEIVSALMALTETITPSQLTLGSDGTVLIEGQKIVTSTPVEKMDVAGPTPALTFVGTVTQSVPLGSALAKLVLNAKSSLDKINSKKPEKTLEEL
ncbi:MAG: hypothetical protein LBU25_11280 [Treponema sp.]|jgi:hypothetical protein|nr:hypothetical protein [Treponema sp.]